MADVSRPTTVLDCPECDAIAGPVSASEYQCAGMPPHQFAVRQCGTSDHLQVSTQPGGAWVCVDPSEKPMRPA